MPLIIITPPSGLAVTLSDAKLHCRVDISDDDALITAMITAAQAQAENRIGCALLTQTLEWQTDAWPCRIDLQRPPVASITSVKYLDTSGVEQTISSGNYWLDNGPMVPVLRPAYDYDWPDVRGDPACIKIRYVAGYGTSSNVPASIAAWIKLAVGELYANRERTAVGTGGEITLGFADSLLDPYKIPRL